MIKVLIVALGGKEVQRTFPKSFEPDFWAEVEFWRMFKLEALRVYAKSRRLYCGGSKTQLTQALAVHAQAEKLIPVPADVTTPADLVRVCYMISLKNAVNLPKSITEEV